MHLRPDRNSFSTKPNIELIGLEKEKNSLHNYVSKGNICFLHGPAGTGKTSTLKWLQKGLRGHKIIYLDGKGLNEYFDLRKYVLKKRSFFQKLFGRKPKNVVLLVDEAQDCLKSLIDHMQSLWTEDLVKSIVLTQISSDISYFPDSFRERIGKKRIRLRRLEEEELAELINVRTRGKHKFDKDAISFIVDESDHVPRKFLELCEISYNELDKNKINEDDIRAVLKRLKENELMKEPVKLEKPMRDLKNDALFSLEKVDNAERLSPLQKKIVKLLLEDRRTTKQIAKILNTSPGSIGKQISELVKLNVIGAVNERRPKLYAVLQRFKDSLDKK